MFKPSKSVELLSEFVGIVIISTIAKKKKRKEMLRIKFNCGKTTET